MLEACLIAMLAAIMFFGCLGFYRSEVSRRRAWELYRRELDEIRAAEAFMPAE